MSIYPISLINIPTFTLLLLYALSISFSPSDFMDTSSIYLILFPCTCQVYRYTSLLIAIYLSVNFLISTSWSVPNIGIMVRVFANSLGDLGSIPGRVIPKTQKMVLDATLLNTQHYKVRIKGKVEQSKGKAPLSYTSV